MGIFNNKKMDSKLVKKYETEEQKDPVKIEYEEIKKLGVELKGNVAVKLHSGEKGNQNYLRPDFMKPLVEKLNATVVECNTAYPGERTNNRKHRKLINEQKDINCNNY